MRSHVLFEISTLSTLEITLATTKWLGVSSHVFRNLFFGLEEFAALAARVPSGR